MSADLRRELAKALDALTAARRHLAAYSESMAALHLAGTVHYSPLHARVTAAISDAQLALERGDDEPPANDDWCLAILVDLDRCLHGRHEGDACGGCPQGVSVGNAIAPAGTVLGHGLRGPIVMPTRADKHDPAAWRQRTADGGGSGG